MRAITDDDRRRFVGLDDHQIASILAHEPELDAEREQSTDDQLIEYNARILRTFGYQGLCDYLDARTGTHELAPQDYDDLLNAVEKTRYSELASLMTTVLAAPDPMSSESQQNKQATINKILKPLEE
ncbi:MAG: hypothetical protein [Caudoviricetes sp.]|nr:MAG: hypothetical protein [Caudoviricetes sp.]